MVMTEQNRTRQTYSVLCVSGNRRKNQEKSISIDTEEIKSQTMNKKKNYNRITLRRE